MFELHDNHYQNSKTTPALSMILSLSFDLADMKSKDHKLLLHLGALVRPMVRKGNATKLCAISSASH